MKPRHAPPAFPEALDGDDDDVAWALQTGGVEWGRGAHAEALVWLRRAIEAAREHRRLNRARDLEFRGRTLQVALEVGWVAARPPIEDALPDSTDDDVETLDADALVEVDVDLELQPVHSEQPIELIRPDEIVEEITLEQHAVEDIELIETYDDSDIILLPSDPPSAISLRSSFEPAPSLLPSGASQSFEPAPSRLPSPPRAPFEPAPSFRAPSEPTPASSVPAPEALASELPPSYAAPFEAGPIMPSSDPAPSEKTLYDRASSVLPPSDQPPAEPEYFEPASMVPPEPADEEPTERDLDGPDGHPGTKAAASVPAAAPRVVELPPPSSSGLFPLSEPAPAAAPEAERIATEKGPDSSGAPHVGGILLSSVAGLQDLPEDVQAALAERAEVQLLNPDEEIGGFGLALVLQGSVAVMPTVADVAAAEVERGQPVFSQGHLAEGVAVRVVAGPKGAEVAIWPPADFEEAVRDCPWVGDELKAVGDRFQALAGVAMGPLGENLDDMLRTLVVERCEVRLFLEGELLAEKGKPLRGMFVLGGGHLEITVGTEPNSPVASSLGSGEFLFASQILSASPAPANARAGKGGALVLFAARPIAHELMVSVPPLLEIFAR